MLVHGREAPFDAVKVQALVLQELARGRYISAPALPPPRGRVVLPPGESHAEKRQQRLGEERSLDKVGGPRCHYAVFILDARTVLYRSATVIRRVASKRNLR